MCVPIDIKISTHIDWIDNRLTQNTCLPCKKRCDQNSATYVSMATKYAIYKAQSVFHK